MTDNLLKCKNDDCEHKDKCKRYVPKVNRYFRKLTSPNDQCFYPKIDEEAIMKKWKGAYTKVKGVMAKMSNARSVHEVNILGEQLTKLVEECKRYEEQLRDK